MAVVGASVHGGAVAAQWPMTVPAVVYDTPRNMVAIEALRSAEGTLPSGTARSGLFPPHLQAVSPLRCAPWWEQVNAMKGPEGPGVHQESGDAHRVPDPSCHSRGETDGPRHRGRERPKAGALLRGRRVDRSAGPGGPGSLRKKDGSLPGRVKRQGAPLMHRRGDNAL